MTTSQIASLFYGHKSSRVVSRLRQLWDSGYLEREFLPYGVGDTSEAIYSPTSKSASAIVKAFQTSRQELGWSAKASKISHWTKQHELEVNQVKIAMILELAERFDLWLDKFAKYKRPDLEKIGGVMTFEKGRYYHDRVQDPENRTEHIPIVPDRFMCLNFPEQDEIWGFWEIDRSSMEEKRFAKKLIGYREYYFSGGFLEKYGKGREIKKYPFRVFTTVPDERRRNRLAQVAGDVGSNFMCWFAVLDDYLQDPFGKVWVRAKEYKELVQDLPLDIQEELARKSGRPSKKVRDVQEEIEKHLEKFSILDEG